MCRTLPALLLASCLFAAAPHMSSLPLSNGDPLTPDKALLSFKLPPGFRAELVAAEPAVTDPVAMAFDEKGRLWVAEMRGYPNGGVGTGVVTSGRIRLLEDADGDGVYEKSTVWADGLRLPTAVMPWRDGLLVANAPDLLFIEGTDDAKAGKRHVLYTGFHTANIQQMLSGFTLGTDGLVHACAGGAGGSITCPGLPAWGPVELRGRGLRFDPDRPGSLQPTSGGGQFGLTRDEFGRWFTATNSQHLRHIILHDEDLRRNPHFAPGAVTLDIPEHGAACKVFRTSPFEAWRLERTTRRAGSSKAAGYPPTELFPGGYATSTCSPLYYAADLFPKEYRGSVFICDPANNAILRDTLTPKGATFVARRGDEKAEFLTSADNWFRPVALTLGPDGAIYVLDFYREVIETPLSLPDDIKKRVILKSQGKGRIWRVTTAREGTRPPRIRMGDSDLVKHIDHPNAWWRDTAARLLLQLKGRAAPADALREVVKSGSPAGRVMALAVLHRHGIEPGGLDAPHPGVREVAVRLATKDIPLSLADDPDPRVRFAVAARLGDMKGDRATEALGKLAARADNDTWTESAILSSAKGRALALFRVASPSLRPRLATLIGAGGNEDEIAAVLASLDEGSAAVLDGLGRGLGQSGASLAALWDRPAAKAARALLDRAAASAIDEKKPPAARAAAVALLGRGPFAALEKIAPDLLAPTSPPEVQLAAAQALSAQPSPKVPGLLLAAWAAAGPGLRREITEALFARPARLAALIAALEKKAVLPVQIEPARLAQLRRLPDAALRKRAAKVLASAIVPARAKVVEAYRPALDLKGDATKGAAVFGKHCAACHRLDGKGHQVGADLLAALRNKTADQLLIDILDPSREVDPRYLAYQVRTKRGTSFTGIIQADTAASITLRRGEGAEDTVLRTQVEAVESTGQSLMPDGLEAQIDRQALADLIAYLLKAR